MKLKPPTSTQYDTVARDTHVWAAGLKSKRPNGLRCHYCGGHANTRDHVVPRKRGGLNDWWNLVQCCFGCNQEKDNKLPTCRCDFCVRAFKLWLVGFNAPGTKVPSIRKTEVRKAEYGWYTVLHIARDVSFTAYWPTWRKAMDSVSGLDMPVIVG